MFSARTDLILSMVIVGMMFLTAVWILLVVMALDGMDGKTDSNAKWNMLWIVFVFGFVEYSMLNALPAREVQKVESAKL